MKKLELVFVPLPAMGHLISAVEFCKLLVGTDDRFSITLLIMKLPIDESTILASTDRIDFTPYQQNGDPDSNDREWDRYHRRGRGKPVALEGHCLFPKSPDSHVSEDSGQWAPNHEEPPGEQIKTKPIFFYVVVIKKK